MTVGIFIKTWKDDLPWLQYCLRSINKFVGEDVSEIVVVADDDCREILNWDIHGSKRDIKVAFIEKKPNGYIYQQIVKLHADQYATSDILLFVDSDCIFTHPFQLSDLFRDGKPILYKTDYKWTGDAICWKAITEQHLGWEVQYEYMRRMPMIIRRQTLNNFQDMFPKVIHELLHMDVRDFSEFNALGAYIEKFESDDYAIIDTTDAQLPAPPLIQFWSWGGITEEMRVQIEEVLG